MKPDMTNAVDSTASDAGSDTDDNSVSLKICIERMSDGSFRVYKDSGDDVSMPPEQGSEAGSQGGGGQDVQTADDLEGALKLVMDVVDNNPDDNSAGAQFAQGFQSEKDHGY